MRMSQRLSLAIAGALLALIVFASTSVLAQDADEQRFDPLADYIMWQMASKLAAAQHVSFHLETTTDVLSDGSRVSVAGSADVALRRPDGLAMHSIQETGRKGFRYDGQTASLYHVDLELYSSVQVPSDIDAMIKHMFDEYEFTFPMADLVLSDPYAALMEDVTQADYVGTVVVGGVRCHHLAFQAPGLQWQIWIEDSMWHYPRKYAFVMTDEPGQPGFTAEMSKWDYGAELPDELFEFVPPTIARFIRFRKVDE